jgi:hypothetical protein
MMNEYDDQDHEPSDGLSGLVAWYESVVTACVLADISQAPTPKKPKSL